MRVMIWLMGAGLLVSAAAAGGCACDCGGKQATTQPRTMSNIESSEQEQVGQPWRPTAYPNWRDSTTGNGPATPTLPPTEP